MKIIKKDEYIPTQEDRDDEDYEPLLTLEEQTEPVTLELTTPIEIDGVETSEITINAPTTKSLLKAQESKSSSRNKKVSDASRTKSFFAECCGCAPDVIEQLHVRDFNRLAAVVWGFTE